MKIYAAHPMASYGTPREACMLAHLARLFPEAEVVNPAEQGWETGADWLAAWAALLPALDLLVVFAAPDETIGAGCLREVTDALVRRVPVLVLDRRGRLRAFGGVRCKELAPSPRSIGWLVLGELADLGEVMR
jgi:hypothetical protein